MKRNLRQTLLPLVTALIWGSSFSAQSVAAEHMGPFTFNCWRSIVAAVCLLALDLAAARLVPGRKHMFQLPRAERRLLLLAGGACGAALFFAVYMQQLGMSGTSAGKAGFITAMYIVIVPLFSLFRGKRATPLLWGSVALAAAGLYFLCVTESFSIVTSDLYVLICAVLFSVHILVVDRFSSSVDGIQMSCLQFATVAVLSMVGMLLTEQPSLEALTVCLGAILYAGVFSSAVGYTLQILAQKDANPTVVSLLLSLESVFAVLTGALLLQERLGPRELLGCALMMAGVLLAQLPAASAEKK